MKKAFTIIDILLTLVIIGFIAVLVLPPLIKNYYSRAYAQHLDVFTTRLSEASRQMAVHNDLGPYKDTEAFINIFKNYLKVEKICLVNNLSDCFPGTIKYGDDLISAEDLSSSESFGKNDYKTKNVGLRFTDGLLGIMSWNPDCDIVDAYNMKDTDPSECISYILDLNGFAKPDKVGKDIVLVGVEININNTETVGVACSKFEGYADCAPTINVDVADSVAVEYDSSDGRYTATSNGSQMSWYLAKKTCEEKGLRLPNASELHSMYIAASKGQIAPFQNGHYWADAYEEGGVYHNCNMSANAGNCGSASYSRKNYVRCVGK